MNYINFFKNIFFENFNVRSIFDYNKSINNTLRNIKMKNLLVLLILLMPQVIFAAEEEGDAPVKPTPSYVSLGEAMVLNLATNSKRLTFLQLKVDILVTDDDAKAAVEANIPALRHQLIVLLSEQKAIDMKTPAKRNDIRKLATEQIKEVMDQLTGNSDIEDVLFSSFLIQ